MSTVWFLEGATAGGDSLFIPLERFPFHIGRDSSCELRLIAQDVSRIHARVERQSTDGLSLLDLESTNGSFINRERLTPQVAMPLHAGDIVHIGKSEFRLKSKSVKFTDTGNGSDLMNMTVMADLSEPLPEHFALQEREFLEMLKNGMVTVAYQPIVDFEHRRLVAYEVLGRGKHPLLPSEPIRLLELARLLNKEVELSEAFRMAGARAAGGIAGPVCLFMNIHPSEMFTAGLFTSLETILKIAPHMNLVIEVHETAVAEVARMKVMARQLKSMGLKFAYDDFGAGQSRLNELAEVPPDYVKFDMSLIRDIHQAPMNKQKMLSRLVHMVADLGSVSLAEGVETDGEAVVCQQMGFKLCQGYLTGRPTLVNAP